ncbi:MAG: hypothetical protein ACE14L_00495 [Terriglobales bacterium]
MDGRRFERMELDDAARVEALTETGRRLGPVRTLGALGMLVEAREPLPEGSPHRLWLIDQAEGIKIEVTVVVRQRSGDTISFDFRALSVEAAVQIGFLMGKHHAATRAAAA